MNSGATLPNRDDAKRYFEDLQAYLNGKFPSKDEVKRRVREAVAKAKTSQNDRSKAFPEGAFLNEFVIGATYEFLKEKQKLSSEEACHALLSESHKSHLGIASGTPASEFKHPFRKVLGATAKSVVAQWWHDSAKSPVSQSCPDLALRGPCPYRIVFEAKYFRDGGIDAARTALATGIYQCFFYLGLPRHVGTNTHAGWDYDFACFLIFDATDAGSVVSAWRDVRSEVRDGCWEGANIYVMVLPTTP